MLFKCLLLNPYNNVGSRYYYPLYRKLFIGDSEFKNLAQRHTGIRWQNRICPPLRVTSEPRCKVPTSRVKAGSVLWPHEPKAPSKDPNRPSTWHQLNVQASLHPAPGGREREAWREGIRQQQSTRSSLQLLSLSSEVRKISKPGQYFSGSWGS